MHKRKTKTGGGKKNGKFHRNIENPKRNEPKKTGQQHDSYNKRKKVKRNQKYDEKIWKMRWIRSDQCEICYRWSRIQIWSDVCWLHHSVSVFLSMSIQGIKRVWWSTNEKYLTSHDEHENYHTWIVFRFKF